MASSDAVTTALRLLACNFAGEVTPEKVKLWHVALDDVADDALERAVPRVIREHTGNFIPPVAVIREACGANQGAVVDSELMRAAIANLGSYTPTLGWCAPRVATVRDMLGAVVADAYGSVGGERLFAAGTTREIALRDFTVALKDALQARGLRAIPPPPAPESLPLPLHIAAQIGNLSIKRSLP